MQFYTAAVDNECQTVLVIIHPAADNIHKKTTTRKQNKTSHPHGKKRKGNYYVGKSSLYIKAIFAFCWSG